MTFGEDVHVPQRMEPNDLMTPTSGVTFLAFIEIFQHILDGSTQTLVQTFIMNDYHWCSPDTSSRAIIWLKFQFVKYLT